MKNGSEDDEKVSDRMQLGGSSRQKGKVKITETMRLCHFDQNTDRQSSSSSSNHIKFHNHNVNKVKHKIQG
jgi:hypothetical protein